MRSSSKKMSEIMGKWMKRRKGHFVVYSKEKKRFVVSLYYLNHPIFRVILEMAEEEFGPSVRGPIQVPCEEELMDSILSLLKRSPPEEIERALVSITTSKGASISSLFSSLQGSQAG